MLLVIVF